MKSKLRGFAHIALILGIITLTVFGGGVYGYNKYQIYNATALAEEEARTKLKNEESAKLTALEEKLRELESQKGVTGDASTTEAMQALQIELGLLKSQRPAPQKMLIAPVRPAQTVVMPAPPAAPPTTPVSPPLVDSKVGLSKTEIVSKVKPAVVSIETQTTKGSGFVVDTNLILTNAHVVEGVLGTTIKTSDKKTLKGYVVARDNDNDIALVLVDEKLPKVLSFGSSDEAHLPQGAVVYIFGFPFGLEGEVSFKDGTISRRLTFEKKDYLEISNSLLAGNSGGPLVSEQGEVVGVNTLVVGSQIDGVALGETIKLSIPGDIAERVYSELKGKQHSYTPTQKNEIRIFDEYMTKYEKFRTDMYVADKLFVDGINSRDQKMLLDAISATDLLQGQSASLKESHPKQLTFLKSMPSMLQYTAQIESQMAQLLPIAQKMVNDDTTAAGYSYYDDVRQRYDQVKENYKLLTDLEEALQTQSFAYFGW